MAASPLTWSSGDDSQVDVMRDGTQVRKTPRSITIWTREVIRLSTPSCTVFGSSPTLTTNIIERRLILVGTPTLGGDTDKR
jgi:hypothetical protein